MTSNTTLVTGIWDLGRSGLSGHWSRPFQHYIDHFKTLLESTQNTNLVIFIDSDLEDLVWNIRDRTNTIIHHHSLENFDNNFFPFNDKIEKIRTSESWLNQAGWLRDSTQAKLKMYNPVVMSKMFLLHNAKIYNNFNSKYLFWIDGGITSTVHPGYFSIDNVIEKITTKLKNFLFVCFPYQADNEIHGFTYEAIKKYSKSNDVNMVARGGFFGGKADSISKANEIYYNLLNDTLNDGYMGTEESIFTIMAYLDKKIFSCEMINSDGLINTFFENAKNNEILLTQNHIKTKIHTNNDVELYLNTFNSPEQLQMVLNSFEQFDINFLTKTKKILINNSTNNSLMDTYNSIIDKYKFDKHIIKGNLGVCGGRQFAAENFAESGAKYMFFFEDDMLLDFNGICQFGFTKQVYNLFDTLIDIMDEEEYDFLKFSFSEFYGHNGKQWSWHNIPQKLRDEYFGSISDKPDTVFNNIKTKNNTPYADGEIYYSNWPHIINQIGNKKMFLDTKWQHPFEQTWMSHIYTLTKQKVVSPAILLASPITHNRVHFYESSERKEN